MSKPNETFGVYLAILLFGLLFLFKSSCKSNTTTTALEPVATAYHGAQYAGSQTCINCHEDIYKLHLKTPHHKTSQWVNDSNVNGDFTVNNKLQLNDSVVYVMTYEDNKQYQSAFINGKLIRKEPFDIVIGSGTKGKTYLYWDDTNLYQLPVSTLTDSNRWINSPGYSNERIHFDRAVIPN